MVIKNDRILDAAAEVLAKRPDATLQTIANAAGISRTTIFNRYPTREDLIQALAIDALQRIGQVMQRIPTGDNANFESALMDTTRGLMPLGPRTTFLRIIPSQANDLEAQWEDVVTPLAILFAQAQSQRQLRSDLRTRWLVASYIGLLFAAWDEITQGELGPSQAARLVVDTWLRGVINTAATE
jgi:AcrR family transcriptional regulator